MANSRPFEGAVRSFVGDLRAQGYSGLGGAILEVVPETGAVRNGELRALAAERLRRVADDDDVVPQLREKASYLADVAASDVKVRGRTGTAWVAWMEHDDIGDPTGDGEATESGWYWVSWQSDHGDDDWIEHGPAVADLGQVLSWCRERTDAIIVRPAWAERTEYWAGKGDAPRSLPPLDESRA